MSWYANVTVFCAHAAVAPNASATAVNSPKMRFMLSPVE